MLKKITVIIIAILLCKSEGNCQSLFDKRIETLHPKDTSDIMFLAWHDLKQFRAYLNVLASENNLRERQRGVKNIVEDREIFAPNARFIDDMDIQAIENDNTTHSHLKIDEYLGRFISRYRDVSLSSINYSNFHTPCFWRDSIKDLSTQKYHYKYYAGIGFIETFSGKDNNGRTPSPHNLFATLEIDYNNGWIVRILDITFCPSTQCCREISDQIPSTDSTDTVNPPDASLYLQFLIKGDSILKTVNAGNWERNGPIAWAYLNQAARHKAYTAKAKPLIKLAKDKIEANNHEADFNTIIYRELKSYADELESIQRYRDAYIMYDWAYKVVADNRLSLRMASLDSKIRNIDKVKSITNTDEAIAGLQHLIIANGESSNPEVWYALAVRYARKCDPRAQIAFEKVHSLDKENYLAYKIEGNYYEGCQCHDYRKASDVYAAYIATFSDTDNAEFKRYKYRKKYCTAMACFMEDKFELAKNSFSDALSISQSPEAQCYEIVCTAYMDNTDVGNSMALKRLKKMLDSNSENPHLNYWCGNLLYKKYSRKNNYSDSAIHYIEKAIKTQPQNYAWKMDLAYKYQLKANSSTKKGNKTRSYNNAIELYKNILENKDVNKNECRYKLAQCEHALFLLYRSLSDINSAERLLTDAKNNMDKLSGENSYKNDTNYMKMYAFIFLSLKKYDSTFICLKNAGQKDPETHFTLGVIHYLQSRNIQSGMHKIEQAFKEAVSHELVNEQFKYCDVNTEKEYIKLKGKYGY